MNTTTGSVTYQVSGTSPSTIAPIWPRIEVKFIKCHVCGRRVKESKAYKILYQGKKLELCDKCGQKYLAKIIIAEEL